MLYLNLEQISIKVHTRQLLCITDYPRIHAKPPQAGRRNTSNCMLHFNCTTMNVQRKRQISTICNSDKYLK